MRLALLADILECVLSSIYLRWQFGELQIGLSYNSSYCKELGTNVKVLSTAKYVYFNYTFGKQENDNGRSTTPLYFFNLRYILILSEKPWQ